MGPRSETPVPGYPHALNARVFERDPRTVAPELLGALLLSTAGGTLTGGIIVETEAYLGSDDPGSHAATKGITTRNSVMYGLAGATYVYFTYGNHHMLNFVCEPEGTAGAVLIRAIEPTVGIEVMTERRSGRPLHALCDGPGKLTSALGIDLSDNGVALGAGRIQVYASDRPDSCSIVTSGRVGLRNGHELPYRYFFASSEFVSSGKTGPQGARKPAGNGEGSA